MPKSQIKLKLKSRFMENFELIIYIGMLATGNRRETAFGRPPWPCLPLFLMKYFIKQRFFMSSKTVITSS